MLGYSFGGHHRNMPQEAYLANYFGRRFVISMPKLSENKFRTGRVMLTQVGEELARLCTPEPVDNFIEYLVDEWEDSGYTVKELPPVENPLKNTINDV